jgi:paraquat-inducible protein A
MWVLKLANLALLVLFPVAWFAPLMTVQLWRWGAEREVSVITGLQALWGEDVVLALLVTFLAVFAPVIKVVGLALVHFSLLSPRLMGALYVTGKLAMADVFLIAVWIVAFRGLGIGTISLDWGLYLFTGCVLASLALSLATMWRLRRG